MTLLCTPRRCHTCLTRRCSPLCAPVQSRTSRLTYLDTSVSGGRPVLILKKNDVVAEHNVPITVTYTFRQSDMLWVRNEEDM